MDGIVEGCKIAGIGLVGGETAEMPDFYAEGVYDLAGFCVGICEREELVTGQEIRPGQVILGLPSSGLHSNGYSLVRKVLAEKRISYRDYVEDLKGYVWEALLEPTRIYSQEIKKLKDSGIKIKGMAHITGGGIPGNLVRVLPEGCRAVVEKDKIPQNPIFDWIKSLGNIPTEEMYRTFNMGVGFMLVADRQDAEKILKVLSSAFVCGYVEEGKRDVVIV